MAVLPILRFGFGTDGSPYDAGPHTISVAGGSTEVPVATGDSVGVYVANVVASVGFSPEPADEDAPVAITITIDNQGVAGAGNTFNVSIATSAGTIASPSTSANPDSWTIGSWSTSDGGVTYTATHTKAGSFADTNSITFTTTPSAAGTLTVTVSGQTNTTTGITGTTVVDTCTVDSAYSLTYAISGSPDPVGTSTTTTWTVTPTVGGASQTSLSVTIRLIYPGTKGTAPTNTLNGWSTAGWSSISGSTWEATFTRASATVGTPTFSFTATSGTTTGTLTADITAGSSAEVPAPTLTDDAVAVASLAITAVWDDADNTIVEDIATTFTITHTPTNFTPNVPTMTVTISTGSTTTSPTTASNPDSWTIGTWTNPGGGTQWSTTISKAGAAPTGASSVQFSTTPSNAGTLGLACSGSNSQSIAASSGTDTLTVTAASATITKTGGTSGNYDAQAYTSETFAGTCSVEFKFSDTGDECGMALSADNPDASYTGHDQGLILSGGTVYRNINGSLTSLGSTTTSNVWKIERVTGTNVVTYYKDGVSQSTSSLSGSLLVDSVFRFSNDQVKSVVIVAGGVTQSVTWNTTNTTVT